MVTLKAKVVQMRFTTWTQRNVIELTHFQDASFAAKSMSTCSTMLGETIKPGPRRATSKVK